MLHASLSLIEHPFSLSIWSTALHSALDARQKEHRSSLLFFSLLPFTIVHSPVGCTSAVTSDPRLEASCIVTRVSLVSHVALSGHVSRDIASQLIPISPPSLEIAVLCPVSGQKPNVKKQVPECKSHPWPA